MRVLVTGGAGFIGSAVCRELVLQQSVQILNLDKLTYAACPSSLASIERLNNYSFVQGDVADRDLVRSLYSEFNPELVLHLAAESHVDRSIDSAEPFIKTNIEGTFTLLEVGREYWRSLPPHDESRFRFVLVSTDEVYGSLEQHEAAFSEGTPYDPSSPYAASKAAADHLTMAWWRTYRFPVMIANFSNNFGPYHFPEKLIPLTIINGIFGEPINVYGDGLNVRDWLYVEDTARALWQISNHGCLGEKYNIGARNERTNLQVVHLICDYLDELEPLSYSRRELIRFVPDRPGHDRRYAIDPTKIERELGWKPAAKFEEALFHTVSWYLSNKSWWGPIREGVYGGERLGVA